MFGDGGYTGGGWGAAPRMGHGQGGGRDPLLHGLCRSDMWVFVTRDMSCFHVWHLIVDTITRAQRHTTSLASGASVSI